MNIPELFGSMVFNDNVMKARLPKDKEAVIKLIEEAIAGKIPLKPEMYRAL